jgi:ring-1,2-phenylacetyl-CoA epoxidase subunit PaaD
LFTEEQIWQALEVVKDPEIPTLSMVDMGIITKVEVRANNSVFVEMTDRLKEVGVEEVEVVTNFETPWDSNKLTARGLMCLKRHGLAPPVKHAGEITDDLLEHVACPFCNSTNTTMQTPFGPTLCRSMHYCNNCLQAFEAFKPVV